MALTPPEGATADSMLEGIEHLQARLHELLAGDASPELYQRPPPGTWSAAEILRHLLFAEQIHLHRLLPLEASWATVGLGQFEVTKEARAARMVGTDASTISEVLEAWRRAHAHVRPHITTDTDAVRVALFRNLRHLRTHTREVERLLRRAVG